MVSLILTYVGGFLLIFLVMYIVIPQLVETIPGIVSSAESAWPKLMAFLQSHNINTQQLEQLFSNFDLGPLLTKVWGELRPDHPDFPHGCLHGNLGPHRCHHRFCDFHLYSLQ